MAASIEIPFVELVAQTNYSFLEGASHPEEIVGQAKALGYPALGITDRNGVYGIPRAFVAAHQQGLSLITGAQITVGASSVFLLAKNRNGYGNLCELLTQAHHNPTLHLDWQALLEKSCELFLLLPAWKIEEEILPQLKSIFEKRLYLLASRFLDGNDSTFLTTAEIYSQRWKIPCIASNQPLFHEAARKPLQDVLTCIRQNCSLSKAGFHLSPNAQRYLKSPKQMQLLFEQHPAWLENTLAIAEQCTFSLDEIRYRYPTEWIPQGETGDSYLSRLAWEGAEKSYGKIPDKVRHLLQKELALIQELAYSDYFLTIWDIVCFARREGILCQGRGSAANSIVCYVLGITSIDPAHLDLLFERFISRERKEPPDIDIDFEHERREEVIQYIYRRYGRNRAAITAEVICFRRKSALREVAKVFEIPLHTVEKIQTQTHRESLSEVPLETLNLESEGISAVRLKQYYEMSQALLSFPRHLGTHVGGFVLCQDLLTRNVPVEPAAMEARTIVQWDKNDLDALGFVRVDILGLGMLTAIRKTLTYLQETQGVSYTLASLPKENPRVYEAIGRADTVGVFQIESRAQMNMLPRLKPRCFYDLVVEVSIVRPGPIQGDMVHPYLKRRTGEEPIDYPHPDLEKILKKTYGVPLFQEQIMKMAMTVAGFTGGEADALRRAMGSWRRDGKNRLSHMGSRFRQGLIDRGVPPAFAEKVFKQIEGFAEYGFPESHAASFAVLVYASAYLKCFHPAAFLTGLLNAQPMGFYSSHSLIHDGLRHGVKIQAIDVNQSNWDNQLLGPEELRLGFRQIRGFREEVGHAIKKCRTPAFLDFDDFLARLKDALHPTVLTKRDLFLLAGANAFTCFGWERRQAFWRIQTLSLQDFYPLSPTETAVSLPKETAWERISHDYEAQSVCLHTHPMAWLRPELKAMVCSKELAKAGENRRVKVSGIVICRQMPPTASGVLFITLEDEFGFINLVIWKKVFEQFRELLLTQSFLVCEGRLQRAKEGAVIHVVVENVFPLLNPAQSPDLDSRDFQ